MNKLDISERHPFFKVKKKKKKGKHSAMLVVDIRMNQIAMTLNSNCLDHKHVTDEIGVAKSKSRS